jgi:hypothetical protein
VERDREALSRCGAGAAGGSWGSVGRWGEGQHLKWAGSGAWPGAQVLRSPGQLTSFAFGTQGPS